MNITFARTIVTAIIPFLLADLCNRTVETKSSRCLSAGADSQSAQSELELDSVANALFRAFSFSLWY